MVETLLSLVIEKLIDLVTEEAKSLKGVHKQVKSLHSELEIIEPLLHDAEAKSARGELSGASKVWMRQLREEAEHIEDVVDEYTYYAEQRRQSQAGFFGSLSKASHSVKTFKTRRDLASEIRDVKQSLREIKERGLSYGLRPFEQGCSSGGVGQNSRIDPRIGSLFLDDDELVGIKSMSTELVSILMERFSDRTVVALVGEGGIGKTTLARKVYNDVVEKGCFDIHVWITVSQSYNIDKILKILIAKICPSGVELVAVEEAFALLRSSLQEKRYVIFFDDVWQNDFWSVVKHVFPSVSNGSSIVFTTRKATVVESFHLPSCQVVVKELKTWPTEQAWELFCKKAFPLSNCPPELEKLSRKILSKCQGLPLAIVAVAGLLSRKKNSSLAWQRVLDSLDYEFKEHRELSSVSKVLLLSYHDLPYNLRICFLYFGVFPEDYLVFEGRLSKIWIAEGFIELRNDKTLEQITNEYLSELISRNLVSFELRYGIYRFCRVHDLIREIIQKGASDLCFYQLFDKNKPNVKETARRLVIYNTTKDVLESVCDMKLRSIVLVNTSHVSNNFVAGLFKKCKLLRVVDFKGTLVNNMSEIGNLLHLKYLNLRGSKVKTLPKSIGNLCNLQTLDVSDTLVRKLPHEINKLHKLRHLLCGTFDLEIKFSVKSHTGVTMHEGFGMLEELQTLGTVEACFSDVGFMKELQRLSKLKILGVSKVSAKMFKALGKSIEKMKDLEQLFLASIDNKEVLDLEFLSSPPLFLRYLQLNCRLRNFPTWVSQLHSLQGLELNFLRLVEEPLKHLKGLPNLAFLRLYEAYDGEELRFEKGSFPKLKKLCISSLHGLKVIKIGRGALVLLEELHIGHSPMIKEMPFNLRHLKNLKLLKFYDMPMEFANSLRPDGGSEYFKIEHIPSVIFKYGKGSMWSVESFEVERSEILQHQAEQQESGLHFLSSVTSHHLSAL